MAPYQEPKPLPTWSDNEPPPNALRAIGAVMRKNGSLEMVLESDPNGIDQHAPGAKCDAGKQLAGVLLDFSRALEAVADVGTFGANKYTRLGWASVPNGEQRYTDALMRHLLKGQREAIDPDSGLDHLAHLAWNCLAVLELRLREAQHGA